MYAAIRNSYLESHVEEGGALLHKKQFDQNEIIALHCSKVIFRLDFSMMKCATQLILRFVQAHVTNDAITHIM